MHKASDLPIPSISQGRYQSKNCIKGADNWTKIKRHLAPLPPRPQSGREMSHCIQYNVFLGGTQEGTKR